jgi:SAM-dependent methyltransferase
MVTGGVFEYESADRRYGLPGEHAACLTGDGVENLTALAFVTTVLAVHVPAVACAFREGGGVPFDAYLPDLHDAMDALFGPVYDDLLVDAIVPLVPGLHERLSAGGRCADVACGTGRAVTNLAASYPASTFAGYDHDPTGLERGRARAEEPGLANVSFHDCDAATRHVDEPFDAIFIFNALHDQVAPAALLTHAHDAVLRGSVLVLDEPACDAGWRTTSTTRSPRSPTPWARCTASRCRSPTAAQGWGTVRGHQTAVEMLTAGFDVVVHDAPGDPGNAVFVATRPR